MLTDKTLGVELPQLLRHGSNPLVKLKHYPIKKLEKEILDIIGKYLDLKEYRVFFFGSRVSGEGDVRSDIDIGVKGRRPVPTKAWLEIKEEIERLPILYKIDVVDFTEASKDFRDVALQSIKPIALKK